MAFARKLRRDMTAVEARLWRELRDSRLGGAKFRRQVPVGRYFADFLCLEHRLIVEFDGPTHDDPFQREHDGPRDRWLRAEGWTVLRFPNDLAIGGMDLLLGRIRAHFKNR